MKIFLSNTKFEILHRSQIKAFKSLILCKTILENRIKLIENIGFEHFNIKEYRKVINISEGSIYRCF